MLSDEKVQAIYDYMPSTVVVDGETFTIEKTFQAHDVVEYTNPTIAMQLNQEFDVFYKSIEEGYTIIDEDTFSLTKDMKCNLLITVAADDTEPLTKVSTFEYQGSAVPTGPYIRILSVSPSTPTVGQNVTITYTRIIRGFDIVRAILRKISDSVDYGFPVCVVSRTSAYDLSRLIGRESLTINQMRVGLTAPYTSVYSTHEENVPMEEVDITCSL